MLTPDYLEHAPDEVAKLMQQLEDDILRDVARRIGKMDTVTDPTKWQPWRLSQIRTLRKEIIKLLARYSGKTEEEIRQLLSEAGTMALEEDDELYRAAGRTPPPINDSPTLVNLLNAGYRQTRGTWQNLTATTANTVTGQFEAALDRAWLQVSSGAFDYKTAIKRAVDDLARDMTYVTYPSGHRDTLEVATRRAVLTGVNQTAGKLQMARMEEMDWEFIETTAHPGARPEHAVWQGKVFHRGGAVTVDGVRYPDFESSTGYGTGPGLCGWNCHHHMHAFFPSLSQRAYTEEQLAQLNARDMEYNGKMYTRYELSQIQRGLERRVRKRKRQYLAEEAAGADTTQAAAKLRTAREQLKQFTRQTGLDLDSSRIGVSGFGRSQASKATAGAARYYKDWADVPGFNAPKTLAEYYQIKYNDPERWARLRRDHDTLLKIDQKSWTPEFKQKAVETFLAFQAEGFEISDHGVARFLNRKVGAKKQLPFSVLDIVVQMRLAPNFVQDDGRLVRFYNNIAVITNPDDVIVSIVRREKEKSDWSVKDG